MLLEDNVNHIVLLCHSGLTQIIKKNASQSHSGHRNNLNKKEYYGWILCQRIEEGIQDDKEKTTVLTCFF